MNSTTAKRPRRAQKPPNNIIDFPTTLTRSNDDVSAAGEDLNAFLTDGDEGCRLFLVSKDIIEITDPSGHLAWVITRVLDRERLAARGGAK